MSFAAGKGNPFELTTKKDAGPVRAHIAKTWTLEEQTEKLQGYIEVPPDLWASIRNGTHIRYFSKVEGFRPGGFVLKNPFDTVTATSESQKRFIKLQNGFNEKAYGYAQWIVAYEDTASIYIKLDAGPLLVMQALELAVKGLNDNIRKIVEHSKRLESKIAALEQR
jgi:hypothetical protein